MTWEGAVGFTSGRYTALFNPDSLSANISKTQQFDVTPWSAIHTPLCETPHREELRSTTCIHFCLERVVALRNQACLAYNKTAEHRCSASSHCVALLTCAPASSMSSRRFTNATGSAKLPPAASMTWSNKMCDKSAKRADAIFDLEARHQPVRLISKMA
jgi:hypothetical protein